jgi:hypothetical protein
MATMMQIISCPEIDVYGLDPRDLRGVVPRACMF